MPRGISLNRYSISQLEKFIKSKRTAISKLERTRAQLAKRLRSVDAEIHSLGGNGVVGRGGVGPVRNKISLNDSIVNALRKAGGFLSISDIMRNVLASGYKTSSPNFRSIVSQALIKDKRFAKAGARGTYQLKK
jgi:hypothetical protein